MPGILRPVALSYLERVTLKLGLAMDVAGARHYGS